MITCTKRLIDLLSWNRILEKREREYRVCGFRTFSYISINYEARICPRYSNGLPPLGPPIRPNYLITRYLVPAPPGGQARRIKVFIRPNWTLLLLGPRNRDWRGRKERKRRRRRKGRDERATTTRKRREKERKKERIRLICWRWSRVSGESGEWKSRQGRDFGCWDERTSMAHTLTHPWPARKGCRGSATPLARAD